jgi:hypothetical protein
MSDWRETLSVMSIIYYEFLFQYLHLRVWWTTKNIVVQLVMSFDGAVGHTVSRRLPIMTAQAQSQVMWNLWWTNYTEADFLWVFWFPLWVIAATVPH